MSKDKDILKIEFALTMVDDIYEYLDKFKTIENLLNNKMAFNATLLHLMQIGESLNKLENSYKELLDKDIRGAYSVRNFIAHDYDGVRKSIIESIIREHLPKLKENLENIIKRHKNR